MPRTRALTVLVLGLLLASSASTAQTPDKNLKAGLAAVSPAETYDLVKTLARPEYAGRLTGDRGYAASAEWAAKKFAAWGLKPVSPKDGYLQRYPSPFTIVDKAEMTVLLPDGKEMKLVPEKDFLPLLYSASADRTAE